MRVILAEQDKRHLGCPMCDLSMERKEGDVFLVCEDHKKEIFNAQDCFRDFDSECAFCNTSLETNPFSVFDLCKKHTKQVIEKYRREQEEWENESTISRERNENKDEISIS